MKVASTLLIFLWTADSIMAKDSFLYEASIEAYSSLVIAHKKSGDRLLENSYKARYALVVFLFWLNNIHNKCEDQLEANDVERIGNLVKKTHERYLSRDELLDPIQVLRIFDFFAGNQREMKEYLDGKYGNIPIPVELTKNYYIILVSDFNEWLNNNKDAGK